MDVTISEILCPFCRTVNRGNAHYCQLCGRDVILNNDHPDPTDGRQYVITRVVKTGGQGAVYQGVDQYGHTYAIKEMLDTVHDADERAEMIARFNTEAMLLQGLNHPRIPRVYSYFTDEGNHYLTMDFIVGEDLEQIVQREGAIDEQRVLCWADQLCEVLAYLHENELVYRDMKPSNIMVIADDSIKLVDFGIAKLFVPNQRGTLIGTPGYSPPEQYQGFATKHSDIFALGATLHHLLTGRDPRDHPPFSFEPVQSIQPRVSSRTSEAIARAVAMRPEHRYQSIYDFRLALYPLRTTTAPQAQSVYAMPRNAPQVAHTAVTPATPATSAKLFAGCVGIVWSVVLLSVLLAVAFYVMEHMMGL